MRRFSDFADEQQPLNGQKAKIDQILNKELVITGHKISRSKFKKDGGDREYLALQVELEGKTLVVFTGSGVLISLIRKYAEMIPFLATIQKIDRYYTFA
jgi:hypothetical protein